MRVVAGKYKGRILKAPRNIRPTEDKVRKSLFDILGQDLGGVRFLDLFAGSGAVGIEALSRGAEKVCFVDLGFEAITILRQNLIALGVISRDSRPGINDFAQGAGVFTMDALSAIKLLNKKREHFDIIFLDPPYGQGWVKKTLQTLGSYDILSPDGLVVVQHQKKEKPADKFNSLTIYRSKSYGETALTFYKTG